jgi:ribosome-associated protein
MIEISENIQLNEEELVFEFIRSSGPGGQNVNKVASAVQLRFNIRNSPSLEPAVRERLEKIGGNRVTADGILVIEAKRFRTQDKNREDALRRFTALVQAAEKVPRIRRATRPSVTARAARVFEKKKRGDLKRIRQYRSEDWE